MKSVEELSTLQKVHGVEILIIKILCMVKLTKIRMNLFKFISKVHFWNTRLEWICLSLCQKYTFDTELKFGIFSFSVKRTKFSCSILYVFNKKL